MFRKVLEINISGSNQHERSDLGSVDYTEKFMHSKTIVNVKRGIKRKDEEDKLMCRCGSGS
jgi:hypothetical protein